MKAKFLYEEGVWDIQFQRDDKAKDVINRFINKNPNLDINNLTFTLYNKPIDPEESFVSQFEISEEIKEIEIEVGKKINDANSHMVNLQIDGEEHNIEVPQGEDVKETVLSKVGGFLRKRLKRLTWLYNGKIIDPERKTFNQLANEQSKNSNSMKILAVDLGDDEENENEQELINKSKNDPSTQGNELAHIFDYTGSYKFFIKLNLLLLIQFIIIFILVYLGFIFDIDIYFSDSSKAFWWTIVLVTLFSLFSSTSITCMNPENSGGKWFLYLIYIPIISIYCFLLSKHKESEVFAHKYIIYQLIIFDINYLFSILYNLIFKRYRGWLLLLILAGFNILTVFIYYVPLSNNYDSLEMSHSAFVAISIISSIMLAFILIFNYEILDEFEVDISGTEQALYGVLLFNYLPFFFIFCLTIFSIVLAIFIALLAIVLGLGILIIALYILFIFISSLLAS